MYLSSYIWRGTVSIGCLLISYLSSRTLDVPDRVHGNRPRLWFGPSVFPSVFRHSQLSLIRTLRGIWHLFELQKFELERVFTESFYSRGPSKAVRISIILELQEFELERVDCISFVPKYFLSKCLTTETNRLLSWWGLLLIRERQRTL